MLHYLKEKGSCQRVLVREKRLTLCPTGMTAWIKEYVETELIIGSHKESIRLSVTQLSSSNIFLGYDWLSKHNPEIDWEKGTIDLN